MDATSLKDNLTAYEIDCLNKVEKVVVDDRVLNDDGYDRLVRQADSFLVADYAARIRALTRALARVRE